MEGDLRQEHEWPVSTDCQSVHVTSELFEITTGLNIRITIDEITYADNGRVNQIVPANFTVRFSPSWQRTDANFVLNWRCTNWGEWNRASDGTCREEKRPVYNGENTVGHLKYRDSTCSKFL